MACTLRQISSLEKIRLTDSSEITEIYRKRVFPGERFSYQIAMFDDDMSAYRVSAESDKKDWVTVYSVRNAVMDNPLYIDDNDADYITREPGLMPDILVPIEEQNGIVQMLPGRAACLWVRIDIPSDAGETECDIKIHLDKITEEDMTGSGMSGEARSYIKTMTLDILPAVLPVQKLIYTQWFHTDCIAEIHHVRVYSEEHWELIDKYMACAADTGINMLLTPVITPPLDTMYGVHRPNVQLLDIIKEGDRYFFDFAKLHRWIELCRKNGIRYFEICQLFSQWGMNYTPNIWVYENGTEKRVFGWHVKSDSEEYLNFLSQMLPALICELEKEDIKDNTYFHISDEPSEEHLASYEHFSEFVRPFLSGCRRMDALSNIEFYEKGLVDVPVTASNHMKPFLERGVNNQWVYYCMGQREKVSNRFLAMPSYRNRIMGLQMYRTGVKGFLQWGFNYYYSRCSGYVINPYQTTSSDLAFPSGDPFSVYPGNERPYLSMRALVFYEGLQDMRICSLLESFIGRDKVVRLIDEEAGMKVDYENYPRCQEFISGIREKMIEMILERI